MKKKIIFSRVIDIVIGFCTKKFPLEEKILGTKDSIGLNNIMSIWVDGDEFSTNYENGYWFNTNDVIGIGIFHFPTIKCFVSYNGKLLSYKNY